MNNPYNYSLDNYGYTTINIDNPYVFLEAIAIDDLFNNDIFFNSIRTRIHFHNNKNNHNIHSNHSRYNNYNNHTLLLGK